MSFARTGDTVVVHSMNRLVRIARCLRAPLSAEDLMPFSVEDHTHELDMVVFPKMM